MHTRINGSGLIATLLSFASFGACHPAEQIEAGDGAIVGSAPAVAVRNGQALATWHRSGAQVRVSRYVGGSGWSVPEVIGTGSFPDVALSNSFGGVVVFGDGPSLQAAVRLSSGWYAQTLATGSALSYAVAMEGGGRAVVVWSASGQVAASIQEGSGWGGSTVLSADTAMGRPQVATNDSGVVFAAWCGAGGVIRGARRAAPSAWEPAGSSASGCCQAPVLDTPGPGVSVGVSASGEGVIVGATATRVCERRYVPGSGWQSTTVLATPGADTTAPQLGIAPDGHALLAWTNSTQGDLVKARAYDPASGWGAVLTGPAARHGRLGVGIGSAGDGAIVYRSGTGLNTVIYSGGTLSAPSVVVSGPGDTYYLRTGFDATQRAQGVSVWQRAGVDGEDIWAARVGL
jgi:hypothetical protein